MRRYDPLFLALQLDDRFISESDFWTGITEHPSLVNGPVVATAGKARICKTAAEVKAFLGVGGQSRPDSPPGNRPGGKGHLLASQPVARSYSKPVGVRSLHPRQTSARGWP